MSAPIIEGARAASLYTSVNAARIIYRRHRWCDLGKCVAKRWAVRVLFFAQPDGELS